MVPSGPTASAGGGDSDSKTPEKNKNWNNLLEPHNDTL